ncbi:FadR family transcriptional regulator [Carnobacterium sp. CS13]|uniref:FadR/GntR family transcriptional regulator n=1 Tax=Carnobacterium sp. CS13 TaxID=2800128 RepID=UPI0019118E71|nr:FCD domain-containing protein [Carnobacterium sp. CS13]QQP70168.1 FadR family transcriptional regulator [Carnobacterium sp. CS13]
MNKNLKAYKVMQNIREHILDGTYPIDSLLPSERELSEMFKVSRMPIRDALEELEKEQSIAKTESNKWMVKGYKKVSLFSEVEPLEEVNLKNIIMESLKARQLVESEGAKLAARFATEEDIKEMRLYLNNSIIELENFVDLKDPNYKEADFQFHLSVAKASHNPLFSSYLTSIKEIVHMHQYLSMKYRTTIQDFGQHHIELFQAINDRNEDKAYNLMYKHLGNVIQLITASY